MYAWIAKDQSDPTKIVIVRTSGFTPTDAICQLPFELELEEADWIDVIEEPSEADPTLVIKTPRLNQAKKDQVLADRRALREALETAEKARLDALRAIREQLRAIRDTDAANLNQANQRLKQLARANLETLRLLIADAQ